MRYLWPSGGNVGMDVIAAPNMKGIPRAIVNGARWAGDVGCLAGPEFVKRCDFDKTLRWLSETMFPYRSQCLFITIPDVVGDAATTFTAFSDLRLWFVNWPLAYVAQDGSENLPFPNGCRTVFIGGITEWKMSLAAEQVIQRAIALDKHVHVGRVNNWRRYKHFRGLPHSDEFTCDGTRLRWERDQALADWKDYPTRPYALRLPFPPNTANQTEDKHASHRRD